MRGRDMAPSQSEAEGLALQALAFLAGEPARLHRFLSLTGISPEDLRGAADSPDTLLAVFDHLMGDESLLLVFAAENGIKAERLSAAHARLSGHPMGGGAYD
jgi:uncharacterized protein DUF3572